LNSTGITAKTETMPPKKKVKRELDPETEAQLKKVRFFIEGDSFAVHTLWKEYSTDYMEKCEKRFDYNREVKLQWEQVSSGFMLTIDEVTFNRKKYPLCIECSFAFVDSFLICFYNGCSMVTHHGMVEDFLRERFPIKYDHNSRLAYTNATNFHHVLQFAKTERNKRVKLAEI
jgi:hypothetical protein